MITRAKNECNFSLHAISTLKAQRKGGADRQQLHAGRELDIFGCEVLMGEREI